MIHLAYDVGPGIGLGHQRRMEALAAGLRAFEAEVAITPIGDDGVVAADVAVVDSYRHRADAATIRAPHRAAVDDLARDLDVDLLIEPAGRNGGRRARRVLAGFDYALVHPELVARDRAAADEDVRTALVVSGGADGRGLGAAVAARLHELRPDITVRLVVGPWSVPTVPDGVEARVAPENLADELIAADLVVCAAGVSLLEALVLGRPAVAMEAAPNQSRYVDALVAADTVDPATPRDAADVAALLVDNRERRRRLAARGPEVVDGRGALRVAEAVLGLG